MYRLELAIDLAKTCKKFPARDKVAIYKALESLQKDPRPDGAIKLVGRDGYRIRVGRYRIIYCVQDHELVILVINIDHRSEVYR